MFARSLAPLAALLLVLPLGGCSYPYDVRAVAIGGELAFIVDPASEFKKPRCLEGITVSIAEPGAEDGEPTYWSQEAEVGTCPQPFPVFYGQPIKGALATYPHRVEARPLRLGVIYEVSTGSETIGYGRGRFRINADRRIENLD